MNQPIRVFLADDHAIALAGLERLLSTEPDLAILGTARDVEGIDRALAEHHPDVLVTDLILSKREAGECLPRWTRTYPRLRIVVVSMIADLQVARALLQKGASAYVCKSDDPTEIIDAIHAAQKGDTFLGLTLRTAMAAPAGAVNLSTLSERERHIFRLVGQGLSNREISRDLFLSVKTVETHKEHIKNKLGLERMTDLQTAARNWVLTTGMSTG